MQSKERIKNKFILKNQHQLPIYRMAAFSIPAHSILHLHQSKLVTRSNNLPSLQPHRKKQPETVQQHLLKFTKISKTVIKIRARISVESNNRFQS